MGRQSPNQLLLRKNLVHNCPMSDSEDLSANSLSPNQKRVVGVFGIITLAYGAFGTFRIKSDAGYTSFVLIGFVSLLIAALGKWPMKIAVGGISTQFQNDDTPTKDYIKINLQDTRIESEIIPSQFSERGFSLATNFPDSESLNKELESSTENTILSFLEFDRAIKRSLRKLFPNAHLVRDASVGGIRVDFQLNFGYDTMYIETKYLKESSLVFKGITLDSLLENLPSNAKLLVIANTRNIDQARQKVKRFQVKGRVRVISWLDSSDNKNLKIAIMRLLEESK